MFLFFVKYDTIFDCFLKEIITISHL